MFSSNVCSDRVEEENGQSEGAQGIREHAWQQIIATTSQPVEIIFLSLDMSKCALCIYIYIYKYIYN